MIPIFLNERNISIAQEVATVARELGRTPSQIALNWLRQRQQKDQGRTNKQIPVIVPIIGARTHPQINDNLGCLDFKLEPVYMQRLDDVSKTPLGFPYDFIDSDMVRGFIYGKTFSLIDDHRN